MLAATPPPPAPYTDGAPGASLWNPDVDTVTIDTVHPQDHPFIADVLSRSCILAQRTRDIAHRHADNTHDTFVAEPFRLDDNFSMAVPPPLQGQWLALFFRPSLLTLLQVRSGSLNTCY